MTPFFRVIIALWLLVTVLVGAVLLAIPALDGGFTLALSMQQRGSLRWQQWLVDVDSGTRLLAYDFAVRPERAQTVPLAFFARSAPDFEFMNYIWIDENGAETIRRYPRAGDFVLSADGTTLFTLRSSADSGTDQTVTHRIDLASGQRELLAELGNWQPYAMSAAPDGTQLALFGRSDEPRNTPLMMLIGTGQMLTFNNADSVLWSPDRRWLVAQNQGASRDTQGFRVVDHQTGQPHPAIPDLLQGRAVAWSPDGQTLYFRISSQLHALDLTTGQTAPVDLIWIDWSPDGHYTLLTRTATDGEALLDVRDSATDATLFTAPSGGLAAWSTDGAFLALVYAAIREPQIRVYRMRDGALLLERPLVGFGSRPNIATPLFLR